MHETLYYWFVVSIKSPFWPYYMEVPYAAWPTLDLQYNSDGDCRRPYDREWSFLDVMNWATYEEAVVWRATTLSGRSLAETRQSVVQIIEWAGETVISPSDHKHTLTPAPIGRLWLYLLEMVPPEMRVADNAIIGTFRCDRPSVAASIADLFIQRTGADAIFDGQTHETVSRRTLEERYLQYDMQHACAELTDEIQRLMAVGEAWHQAHPKQFPDWWKTLPQLRNLWGGTITASLSAG